MSMAESERFPEQAKQYIDVLFQEVQRCISDSLKGRFSVSTRSAAEAAEKMLGRLMYPSLHHALFGTVPLAKTFNQEGLDASFDEKPI